MNPPESRLERSKRIIGRFKFESRRGKPLGIHSIRVGGAVIVGRDSRCQIHIDDPTVSNKHLKIYSIIHDQDDQTDVEPLVYVEDVSSNGSYWNGMLMVKSHGAILLSHGDMVRISRRVVMAFCTVTRKSTTGTSHLSNLSTPVPDPQIRSARSSTTPSTNDTSSDDSDQARSATRRLEEAEFKEHYRISNRKLGSGAHGQVFMAISHQQGRQFACKIVDLEHIHQEEERRLHRLAEAQGTSISDASCPEKLLVVKKNVNQFVGKFKREIDILKHTSHPNIVRLEKVFTTQKTYYIFQELLTGGDVYSYLLFRGGRLGEIEAAVLIRQVLEAVKYLHGKSIVHRDIKLENILVTSQASTARVVLTDFGYASEILKSGSRPVRLKSLAGTYEYVAPEIYGLNPAVKRRGYTKSVDMWSVGCVTTALLTGAGPFTSSSKDTWPQKTSADAILESAARCDLERLMHRPGWMALSSRGKDFIKRLLELDENARMTAEQALDHMWYTAHGHKKTFDKVYDQAVGTWKPRIVAVDIVETLRLDTEHSDCRKRRSKKCLPIEPYYRPPHRSTIASARDSRKRSLLPTISETVEDLQSVDVHLMFPALQMVKTVPKDQPQLPHIESLAISEEPGNETGPSMQSMPAWNWSSKTLENSTLTPQPRPLIESLVNTGDIAEVSGPQNGLAARREQFMLWKQSSGAKSQRSSEAIAVDQSNSSEADTASKSSQRSVSLKSKLPLIIKPPNVGAQMDQTRHKPASSSGINHNGHCRELDYSSSGSGLFENVRNTPRGLAQKLPQDVSTTQTAESKRGSKRKRDSHNGALISKRDPGMRDVLPPQNTPLSKDGNPAVQHAESGQSEASADPTTRVGAGSMFEVYVEDSEGEATAEESSNKRVKWSIFKQWPPRLNSPW